MAHALGVLDGVGYGQRHPPGISPQGEDLVVHLADHGFQVQEMVFEREVFPVAVRQPNAGLVEVEKGVVAGQFPHEIPERGVFLVKDVETEPSGG